ncbi:prolipoprotein diacylglyceryl transferase [Agrococcus sp. HG114]|uniref:prolipoprotein diacylglyceryl transferase n=1 Tax=Agrococcus sp. HG114 TaxID=2969757 RepID=UPI00215B3EB4|nr:prolipoprotein diacylglyceryl transferase [Agrococcus sp. HG114]MCR8670677.1 prolipoprotein diacylglyceryl transferase [Agrococcus sp. HG114]
MTVFQSIPSPAPEWQQVPVGQWLDAIGVLGLVQGSLAGAIVFGLVLGVVLAILALAAMLAFGRLTRRDTLWTIVSAIAFGLLLTWVLRMVTPAWGIQTYALCILAGIVVAAVLTGWRLRQRGVDAGYVIDIAVWAVLLGIVAARIFHVVTHPDDYFGPGRDPMTALYIWEGGIAIFGALLGGALGVWIGCRQTGLRFSTFADALAPGLLLAQAFGRLGNWFNHELFGQPTDLPWGLEIEATNPAYPVGLPEGILFHPTFAYEILWNVAGAALLLWLDRRRDVQWGRLVALYLVWYGVGRSVFETIRLDPSELFLGIRTNVWMAFLAIVVGVVVYVVQTRRHPGLEPSPWQPGRQPGADEALDSDVYTETPEPRTQDEAVTAAEPAAAHQ